jgi:hypothetical protein
MGRVEGKEAGKAGNGEDSACRKGGPGNVV